MLPDFIKLKQEIFSIREGMISLSRKKDPLLSMISTYRQNEGDRFTIFREDGSQETRHHKKISAEMVIDSREVQTKGESVIQEAVDNASEQVEKASKDLFFDMSHSAVESVGNSFDAGGKPLTAELILDAEENLEFSFDDDGNWIQPTLVVGPKLSQRLESELKRIETEPELRRRREEMIAKKREEWDATEANRKLVD